MSFNFMAAITVCSDFGDFIKSVTVSIFSSSICHNVMGMDCQDLSFLNAEVMMLAKLFVIITS